MALHERRTRALGKMEQNVSLFSRLALRETTATLAAASVNSAI